MPGNRWPRRSWNSHGARSDWLESNMDDGAGQAGAPVSAAQEPKAVNRQAAREMRDLFNALVAEGFTEPQALTIIGHVIAGASPPPS